MKKAIFTLFLLSSFVILSCFGVDNFAIAKTADIDNNSFRIVRKIDSENRIFLYYIFPVNTEFMENNFTEKEVEVYKFYLAAYVNALKKANEDNRVDGVEIGPVLFYVDVDGIGFSITFDGVDSQAKFFGTEQRKENKTQTERKTSGLFLRKTHIKTQFPISSKKSAEDFRSVCVLAISAWSKECNISEEKKNLVLENLSKATYVYDFALPNKTLFSKDMYEENGFRHNVFSKTIEEIEKDCSIEFWVSDLNKGAIYVLTLVLVLIGTMVALFLAKRKEKTIKIT